MAAYQRARSLVRGGAPSEGRAALQAVPAPWNRVLYEALYPLEEATPSIDSGASR
jgi:hypothetical protein